MPVHAAAHLGCVLLSFFQSLEDGNGVYILAGDGRAGFSHFGILVNIY
jgi:hypothetical protein